MSFESLFFLFFVLIVGNFAWRYLRSGRSLTGALLGGRVTREIGEVTLNGGSFTSQVLRVMAMEESTGEKFIAVSVVSKAPMGASMVPYKLSRTQAQELVALLQQAARE